MNASGIKTIKYIGCELSLHLSSQCAMLNYTLYGKGKRSFSEEYREMGLPASAYLSSTFQWIPQSMQYSVPQA